MDINVLINNLKKKGYEVSYFETHFEAVQYLNRAIDNYSVGIGGSMTVKEIGLYDALKSHNKMYWHWEIENRDAKDIMKEAQTADIYISSVNGIAETGEIVNIDGTCNRISATLYGHNKVYFILGVNKIEENLEKAIDRARNIAAPMNAKRLNYDTPCVKLNKCIDCNHSQRICRGLSIFLNKPKSCPFEIIIINEKLGY